MVRLGCFCGFVMMLGLLYCIAVCVVRIFVILFVFGCFCLFDALLLVFVVLGYSCCFRLCFNCCVDVFGVVFV